MKTIIQKIKFKASPKALFEMYMDEKKHGQITQSKALVSRREGGSYSVHGGYIKGRNLRVKTGEMIVQTWRAADWAKKDRDSILVLAFEAVKGGSLVTMVQANVPDRHAGHLTKGWKDHYWKPWAKYLKDR